MEAFRQVSVSYDPGSVVSDIEAGGFPLIVGSNPKVAFMPASASSEIVGGPDAIAAEIARPRSGRLQAPSLERISVL